MVTDGFVKLVEKDSQSREQLRRVLFHAFTNYRKFPDDCDHRDETFNGYAWRCKECGKSMENS